VCVLLGKGEKRIRTFKENGLNFPEIQGLKTHTEKVDLLLIFLPN
jgi:hypothetical protein